MYRAIDSESGSFIASRCLELRGQLLQAMRDDPVHNAALLQAADLQVDECLEILRSRHFLPSTRIPIAQTYFDAAFILYLRASPEDTVAYAAASILAAARDYLPPKDSSRQAVENIIKRLAQRTSDDNGPLLEDGEDGTLLSALEAAQHARAAQSLRVRSFVRIVTWVGIILTGAAAIVALMGVLFPDNVPLCFVPEVSGNVFRTVCPVNSADAGTPAAPSPKAISPADYAVVETIGITAAGLAAATAIRRMRGTTTPYNVALALAFLKLPTGALTAPLGILLMRGGFVPGLSALDSSAQIVAWAIIFGYAQQVLTFMVDKQAQTIVGKPDQCEEWTRSPESDPSEH
jgi:hypothetical protein